METIYLINPCAPLIYDEKQADRCGNDTYICQIITNYLKDSDQKPTDPRTISIKPIAGGDQLDPSVTLGPALNNDEAHGKF